MKNYRLIISLICFVAGLLAHVKVFADNNDIYLRRAAANDDSKKLCSVVYTAIAGTQGFSNEDYPSLVDGNYGTKWCCSPRGSMPCYIIFRASEKIVPTWYRLVTGNDTGSYNERNWKSWKIYGANFSNDNVAISSYNNSGFVDNNSRLSSDWILIDDKNNYTLPASDKTEVEVDMSNPSAEKFQYFLVEIYETVGNSTMQMGELSFGTQGSAIPANQNKNYLSIPTYINIANGVRFDLPVSMTNEDDISSLQFDLIIPEGFAIATDENGNAIIELSDRTNNKRHTVSSRKLDSGAYRIVIVSATNNTFEDNSGEIMSIGVTSSSDLPVGEYVIIMQNIVLTNPSATRYTAGKVSGILKFAGPVIVTAKSYSREYGDANPTFEYTSEGAALEGEPEIICEATATSPVGEYPIVIKKGGVTNYNDTYVNGVLTITKAPLIISAKSYSIKQGDTLPTFDVEYSGFKNNETKEVLAKQPSVVCEATSASVLGEYTVTVSGAEAQNYEISYTNGKLTVTDADPVTLTAKSYSREYGDVNPTFEYTVEGAALEGEPEIICEATATSPAGEYPIVIKKGGVTNYNDTYVNGVLTITKAPLTISVGNYTKKQYDPMPEFTVAYDGFKNKETEDVLSKQPIITCKASGDSAPGEYDITLSGAEAANYDIRYVAGKLTVTEPDSYTLTYMVDGEVYQTFSIKYRDVITPLEVPEKEGYSFSGWSEIPQTMPANDVIITGTFTINSYTLTYMVDGKEYKKSTVTYGTAITPEAEPTKEGYTFSGWSEIPQTMPANDVIITGTFTINSYTLTYMVDGEVYQSFTVKYKEAITPIDAPRKEGYTFSGWDGLPRSMPAKDVLVKGYFTINSYTITYVLDGEVYTTETLEYGAKIVPPVIPGLEEYTIWEDVPATMPASDITIYGKAKDIIDSLTPVLSKGECDVYDLNGRRLSAPQKGMNIIRMRDGTVKKINFK